MNKVLSLAVADTDLYATSFSNGVYASTDNGKNWTYAANGIIGSHVTSVSGNGSNVFAVFNSDSLYSSMDNGNTWLADTGLKNTGQGLPYLGISSIYLNNSSVFKEDCGAHRFRK